MPLHAITHKLGSHKGQAWNKLTHWTCHSGLQLLAAVATAVALLACALWPRWQVQLTWLVVQHIFVLHAALLLRRVAPERMSPEPTFVPVFAKQYDPQPVQR